MKILHFLERVLPLLFWILLMLGFDLTYVAILTLIAALLHEGGHLIALTICKKRTNPLPSPTMRGFIISIKGLSYKEELLVALCGPLVNLILGLTLISLPISSPHFAYMRDFGILNLITAASNLIPIEGYDGYRICHCIFSIFSKNEDLPERILRWVSFFLASVMCFLSLYLILKIGEGYWIFAVFFTSLLSAIAKRKKSAFCEKK